MEDLQEVHEGRENEGLSLELDDKVAEGIYSNLAVINHSATEFVVDFVSVMPGMPKGKVRSRIVLTPDHAKRLLNALADNIQKFENAYGKIVDNNNRHAIPLFGMTGEA